MKRACEPGYKFCTKCQLFYPQASFATARTKPGGLQHNCRLCSHRYYLLHRDAIKAKTLALPADQLTALREKQRCYSRDYYARHRAHILAKGRERYCQRRPNKRTASNRAYYLQHRDAIRARRLADKQNVK